MDLGVFTCKVSLTEKEYTDTLSVMFRNQFNYVTVFAALACSVEVLLRVGLISTLWMQEYLKPLYVALVCYSN